MTESIKTKVLVRGDKKCSNCSSIASLCEDCGMNEYIGLEDKYLKLEDTVEMMEVDLKEAQEEIKELEEKIENAMDYLK